MNPTPPLTYLKVALLMVLVLGIFVLAAMGKIDATTAVDKATIGLGGLLVALGLGSAGMSVGSAVRAHAAIMSGQQTAPAAPTPPQTPLAKAAQRGAATVRSVVALACAGALLLVLAACPQAVQSVPPALDCGTLVVDEALKGLTLEQIIADAGPRCGLDVLQIIGILTAPTASPNVTATHAAAQARDLRARMQLGDAGGGK